MFRLSVVIAAAALTGAALSSGGALAQANCDEYGRLALKQQKENETGKCGFKGPEWSADLKAHVSWCQSVGPDKWKEQLQLRTQALGGCTPK
jgi:hypothetical protein